MELHNSKLHAIPGSRMGGGGGSSYKVAEGRKEREGLGQEECGSGGAQLCWILSPMLGVVTQHKDS